MERLSLYQAMPTEKLPQSYISWVIKLYKLGDKTVWAGPEDCFMELDSVTWYNWQ